MRIGIQTPSFARGTASAAPDAFESLFGVGCKLLSVDSAF